MREAFITKRFSVESAETLDWINSVLDKYRALGYDLTVRQVYYQLVAQDLIPNNIKSYSRIQRLISDGRKAGLISWDMIVDRTRSTIIPPHWDDPGAIIQAAADSYAVDKWENQQWHIEIMCEKEALAGILGPACDELDINFTSNRGYASDSLMYQVAKRVGKKFEDRDVAILYFGDHDPSGLDMDRDIMDRVSLFSEFDIFVNRLALLREQVDRMNLPENPAKTTDSRFEVYAMQHGMSSWELDAVEPTELVRLLTEAVVDLRDEDLWEAAVNREEDGRQELQEFADQYGYK
jgi:hypothetical protein